MFISEPARPPGSGGFHTGGCPEVAQETPAPRTQNHVSNNQTISPAARAHVRVMPGIFSVATGCTCFSEGLTAAPRNGGGWKQPPKATTQHRGGTIPERTYGARPCRDLKAGAAFPDSPGLRGSERLVANSVAQRSHGQQRPWARAPAFPRGHGTPQTQRPAWHPARGRGGGKCPETPPRWTHLAHLPT